MQINYVIAALAGRHAQQRMKRRGDAADSWLTDRGKSHQSRRPAQVLGLIQLRWRGAAREASFWVLAPSVDTNALGTPLTWPASDELLLLSKHACQVAVKPSLMSTLRYLPKIR